MIQNYFNYISDIEATSLGFVIFIAIIWSIVITPKVNSKK